MLTNTYLALLGLPGGSEIIIIGIIALLLFGARLPKVARSMGKSIVEFKKGIKNVQEDIDDASDDPAPPADYDDSKESSPPPPEGGSSSHREKGDLSNPGDSSSS
ncbi:MAG: twin-arginine translocase TatA/TatE family subunit [Planctomycetota bacterium]|nr:twin-arginine translocase TatA/TatE family subunit [Planctomycetota bacterium]MEC9348697.1 twin-arginine translocase TatA/TatE family subunit [Planctomycetota bacterium]